MGLYDAEIKKSLFDCGIIESSNTKTMLIRIIDVYEEMRSKLIVEIPLQDLLKKLLDIKYADTIKEHQYTQSQILRLLDIIIVNSIGTIQVSCNMKKEEILNKVWELYQEKNDFYGDIWPNRRESGLCLDMGRKIVRIQGFLDNSLGESTAETMLDTLLDLVNYCNLIKVYLTYIKEGDE